MRDNYDEAMLTEFYDDLMQVNFPISDELDDIEDWIAGLDPSKRSSLDPKFPESHLLLALKQVENGKPEIAGGIFFEYYKLSNVGLMSYMVVADRFRRNGIIKRLHAMAIEQLHAEACRSGMEEGIGAIFAESNLPTMYDGIMSHTDRHAALHRLGYRQVNCVYTQPPLSSENKPQENLALIVYAPHVVNDADDAGVRSVKSVVIAAFVTDFALSVFDYSSEGFAEFANDSWYIRTLSTLQQEESFAILPDCPFVQLARPTGAHGIESEDDLGDFVVVEHPLESVVVVGGGVAGMSAALELAKSGCQVTLVEADSRLGGRVRTVEDKSVAPWPLALGAEFVHGSRSVVNEMVETNGWTLSKELFNLSSKPTPVLTTHSDAGSHRESPVPTAPLGGGKFLRRRQSENLQLKQMEDSTFVFLEEKLIPYAMYGDSKLDFLERHFRPTASLDDTVQAHAQHFWETHVCTLAERVYENENEDGAVLSPFADMSLKDYFHFLHRQTTEDVEELQEFCTAKQSEDCEKCLQTLSVLDAVFARTAGTGISRYGVAEAAREEYQWKYGDENYRLKGSYAELVDKLTSDLALHGVDVRLGWKATSIEWEGEPEDTAPSIPSDLDIGLEALEKKLEEIDLVLKQHRAQMKVVKGSANALLKKKVLQTMKLKRVYEEQRDAEFLKGQPQQPKVCVKNDTTGEEIVASSTIICVPHTILLERGIHFDPPLPAWKTRAIDAIQMGSAIKVIARFTQRFWGTSDANAQDPSLLFCPDAPFSQIWFDIREDGDNGTVVVATGFQTGDTADRLKNRTDSTLETIFIHQLDDIFGEFGAGKDSNPASKRHQSSVVYHWGRNTFVKGGYSSPTPGSGWGWVWKRQADGGPTNAEQREDTMRSKIHAHFASNLSASSSCGDLQNGMKSIAMLTSRQHLYLRTARHDLAASIADRLFFAGEATHLESSATVQSAIETGLRSATEVTSALTHHLEMMR
jgi:monoamine oxidase